MRFKVLCSTVIVISFISCVTKKSTTTNNHFTLKEISDLVQRKYGYDIADYGDKHVFMVNGLSCSTTCLDSLLAVKSRNEILEITTYNSSEIRGAEAFDLKEELFTIIEINRQSRKRKISILNEVKAKFMQSAQNENLSELPLIVINHKLVSSLEKRKEILSEIEIRDIKYINWTLATSEKNIYGVNSKHGILDIILK